MHSSRSGFQSFSPLSFRFESGSAAVINCIGIIAKTKYLEGKKINPKTINVWEIDLDWVLVFRRLINLNMQARVGLLTEPLEPPTPVKRHEQGSGNDGNAQSDGRGSSVIGLIHERLKPLKS